MPSPIPIICKNPSINLTMSATAFLVSDGNATWLATCAHGFSKLVDTPDNPAYFESSSIEVLGDGPTLPLCVNGRSRYITVPEPGTGNVWDVISVKLEADEAESLASFGAYDVTEIVAPTQDAPACADGFPGMKEKAIPPTTLSADVARLVGISIQLSEPSHPGWSGSALTDANGLIGIVHGDLGTKTNLVAGLALRLELLRHDLFR